MFRKGSKVIYPVYGAGKITAIYDEKIGNNNVLYYQIEFVDSLVSVAVPVRKSENLGLREPLSASFVKQQLKSFKKAVRLNDKMLLRFEEEGKVKLNSGRLEDAIEIYKILMAVKIKKSKNKKQLSATEQEMLEISKKFIQEEVRLVLGKKAGDKILEKLL